MKPSIFFLVPTHGRLELTAICLRQLRRTCDSLDAEGLHASAVVVACDENLDIARELGFGTVERDNDLLGRRWNDAYQAASIAGVSHVIPFGSDDWIDPAWILTAPINEFSLICPTVCMMVDETGSQAMTVRARWEGGLGFRITPIRLLEPLRFRPIPEDSRRMIDTWTLRNLKAHTPQLVYYDLHDIQIVDWKTEGENLGTFAAWQPHRDTSCIEPFGMLAGIYPAEALEEMSMVYERKLVAA